MKKTSLILLIAALTFTLALACQPPKDKTEKSESTKVAEVSYVCPMHPEVVSDKPAQCSKCGMELEKKENGHDEKDHMHADSTKHE